MTTKRRILLALVAVALIATAVTAWFLLRPRPLSYSGTVETREIEIGSKVGGRVTQVPVEEGQHIRAGAVLVRFECDELIAQRAQAGAQVEQALADLDRMLRGNRPEEIAQADATAQAQFAALQSAKNGPRRQEIDQAQADFDAAQADARNARINYDRMAELVAKDVVSRQQFDDARDKRDSAVQKAESARQHLALLQAGTRKEDLDAAQARYHQAQAAATLAHQGFRKEDIEAARGKLAQQQAALAELDARLREAVLTAPTVAVVETVSIRPGDLVAANKIVMELLESSQLWVRIYIPETELAHVHLGQSAQIHVDSYPGRAFIGKIGQIASQAEYLPRNVQTRDDRVHQVFAAKVFVDNSSGILKSGMSATVTLQ